VDLRGVFIKHRFGAHCISWRLTRNYPVHLYNLFLEWILSLICLYIALGCASFATILSSSELYFNEYVGLFFDLPRGENCIYAMALRVARATDVNTVASETCLPLYWALQDLSWNWILTELCLFWYHSTLSDILNYLLCRPIGFLLLSDNVKCIVYIYWVYCQILLNVLYIYIGFIVRYS